MGEYPKTTLEFEKYFKDEEDCRKYLYAIRWPDGFICPHCRNETCWEKGNGIYRCKECRYDASVKSRTIFHGSQISLRIWFHIIWEMVGQKHGISALGLKRILGIRYETIWVILHKLRIAMVSEVREPLKGSVEVDEIFVGGPRSGKAGRGAENKTLVVVAVEDKGNKSGRLRLCKVKDASAKSLSAAIKRHITPGSEILTDGWKGYLGVGSIGYKHTVIRETDEVGKNLLPVVNRVASLLKRWLLGTHQGRVSPELLDYYLDEFVFRFNRRTSRSRGLLFYRLLQQAVMTLPVDAKDIGKYVS